MYNCMVLYNAPWIEALSLRTVARGKQYRDVHKQTTNKQLLNFTRERERENSAVLQQRMLLVWADLVWWLHRFCAGKSLSACPATSAPELTPPKGKNKENFKLILEVLTDFTGPSTLPESARHRDSSSYDK